MKTYTHESEQLNNLLGKKVKVTLIFGNILTGILTRGEWKPGRYQVQNWTFRKTHVKNIQEIR